MDPLAFIVGIAWPVVVLTIGIYFRNEIRSAFSRIKELGPSGVKLEGLSPAAQQTASPPNVAANELISGIKQFIAPDVIDLSVAEIRKDLSARSQNREEQIEMLVHALASANVRFHHQRNYNLIFGSQLGALARMNVAGGVTEEVVKPLYSEAATRFPDVYENFKFEDWLGFLLHGGLTLRTGDRYELTPFGRSFLRYIVDQRLSALKPY